MDFDQLGVADGGSTPVDLREVERLMIDHSVNVRAGASGVLDGLLA